MIAIYTRPMITLSLGDLPMKGLTMFGLFLCVFCSHIYVFSASLNPEKLVYKIQYMGVVPVGECFFSAEASILGKKEVYKISANYDSPKWFSLFFKASADIHSIVDSKTLLPIQYEESFSYTGHLNEKSILSYDQQTGQLKIDENGRKEEKKIPLSTLDPLSIIYYMKTQIWKVGETRKFNLNSHHNNYQLSMECLNQEKGSLVLQGNLKRSDLLNGPPKAQFRVWLDLQTQVPFKINLKTKLGYITLKLI